MGILRKPLYIGRFAWNRSQWVTILLPRILHEYTETIASLEVVTQPQVNNLRHKIRALVGGSI